MRLIDADALPVRKAHCVDEAGWGADFCVVDKSDIDNAPTIEAEPVIHCKECKHGNPSNVWEDLMYCNIILVHHCSDSFCSYGERRTDDV